MEHPFLVLIIFILTYLFIAIQRLPGLKIDRPAGVIIGSTLLILTGLITIQEAYSYIDWNVITFLMGMMILIAYLEFSGFFAHTARWLVRISGSPSQLMGATILSSSLLSAFFVNDTICLLFTPILLKATRYLKLNPIPYLIALAFSANIGSALTVTGNPQNMYIGIHSGISYLHFLLKMLLPVCVGLLFIYMIISLIFRKDLRGGDFEEVQIQVPRLKKILTLKTLLALAVTVALFIMRVGYPLAALTGATIILIISSVSPRRVFKDVDWTVLLFFAGLFVVMGAFEKAGYMHQLISFSEQHFSGDKFTGYLGLSFVTVLLSNVVSNVPAVILMKPLIVELGGGQNLWLLLAMASTFAGNLTLVGSVANLIVAEKAPTHEMHLGFMDYLKAGVPIAIITVLLGTLWLWWTH
ncbi:MAG: anion transporter [Calditrichia bacterium]